MSFRSGFVAVVGRPNVGKSTLVNALVGHKVSIVSDKPQTTRHRIQAIWTSSDAQVIFIDTPGLHRPRDKLGERLVRAAQQAWREVDIILFVVDAAAGLRAGDRRIAADLGRLETPLILGINKIDAVADRGQAVAQFDPIDPGSAKARLVLSALTGEGLSELSAMIRALLPEGPRYYPADWVTDHPEQWIVAELIREKILELTRDEVPHAVAVRVDAMEQREGAELVDVRATIFVERESQKGIVIGRAGRMLREIGSRARQEIEALLGSRIYLELRVKVREGWRQQVRTFRELGLGE